MTITQDQFYQLVGLATAGREQQALLDALVLAAVAITQEKDDYTGGPSEGGRTADAIYTRDTPPIRAIEEALRKLDITVQKEG